jgi:hypothetical protein
MEQKMLPALYGGLVIGLLSSIPFVNFGNCLCCAWVLLGGVLAVFFYTRDLKPGMPMLTIRDGMVLGCVAGLIGGLIAGLIGTVLQLAFSSFMNEYTYNMIIKIYSTMGILDKMPPEALEQIEEMRYSGVGTGQMVINMISFLVVSGIFGLLGGLIGFKAFKSKALKLTAAQPGSTVTE